MFLSQAIDVLLPRRCLLCLAPSLANLCPGCDADLPAIAEACHRCGIPFDYPWQAGRSGPRVCGACITRPPPYERTIAALHYQFPVPVLVQRFKFNRSFACGVILADRLLRVLRAHEDGPEELIVPVPLHPARQFRRVFNQAEVLARDIGKAMNLPVLPRALRRTRRTPAQSGLSARMRRRNLRGAFAAQPTTAKHVALVDDVMTTGATAAECAMALRRVGVESVSVWVAARAA